MRQNEGVHLALYEMDDMRGAIKISPDGKIVRANTEMLRNLLSERENT
jgi:DNA integrity scanning protein DisA with diadenylate cyclase activity